MVKTLEELIKKEIKDLLEGKRDKRVKSFTDYENKYAILKPQVRVEVSLNQGIVATIDVSDYFTEELK